MNTNEPWLYSNVIVKQQLEYTLCDGIYYGNKGENIPRQEKGIQRD